MSRKDRQKALQKQLENLQGGKYGESYQDKYHEIIKKSEKDIINIDINLLSPAPNDWNFFPEISDDKMLEMMFSIQENGLFNPIIVWERHGRYMILSGHNRVRAYKRIINEYEGAEGFDKKKYETIPAIVYRENEIDEIKAREIIIDTNYIQRDEDKRIMPQIVKNRLEIVKNRKDVKGRTMDIVAKELGISATKVYEDQLIANRIIPELNELYFNGELKKKSLLRFAWFDKETQNWIKDNFMESIDDEKVMRLKKNMPRDEIKKCLTFEDNINRVYVTMRMAEEITDEFKEMANEWIEDKENELKEKSK